MAFRRRRRGRRGVWLPVLGHNLAEDPGILFECSFERELLVGPLKTDVFSTNVALTFDNSPQVAVGAVGDFPNMSDFLASGYSLRRIVGKLHLAHGTIGSELPGAPAAARIIAYFMVRRVDDAGNELAGSNEIAANLADNIQDPYIWRQSWILGGGFEAERYPNPSTSTNKVQDFPPNNVFDGGSKQQPFFDIKTKRTVGPEERLFFGLTTKGMPLDVDYGQASNIYAHLDFRMFAFPQQSYGNRNNASR